MILEKIIGELCHAHAVMLNFQGEWIRKEESSTRAQKPHKILEFFKNWQSLFKGFLRLKKSYDSYTLFN